MFVKTRGNTIHIGTKAVDAITDTYKEVLGVKTMSGNFGSTAGQIDGSVLKDDYVQTLKGVRNAGSLQVAGQTVESEDDAKDFLDEGQFKLKQAAEDDSDDPYNFKIVRGNGRTWFLKARVFGFTRSLGSNTNLNDFQSTLMFTEPPTPEPLPGD